MNRFACELSLGILTLLAGLGSAEAVTLASATASLTHLQITLVDLDPTDGIAPSVAFGPGLLSTTFEKSGGGYDVSNQTLGSVFGSALSGSAGPISHELSASGISLSTLVDSADLSPAELIEAAKIYSVSRSGNANYSAAPDLADSFGLSKLSLSANTRLIITGTASAISTVASSADVASASPAGLFDPSKADLGAMTVNVSSAVQIGVLLASVDDFASGVYEPADPDPTNVFFERLAWVSEVGGPSVSDIGVFTLSFSNSKSQAADAVLFLNMSASASAIVTAPALLPEVPQVPTIPEPSTCLLMGLGLVGIFAARARQPLSQNIC